MVKVHRAAIRLEADSRRVLIRPFFPFDDTQNGRIVARIMSLTEKEVEKQANAVLKSFTDRHFDVADIFEERFETVRRLLPTDLEPSQSRKQLIGACFTSEYSLEAAALFNPSIVPHPDQSGLGDGDLRFIMSLRAVGEGHVSSILFKEGIIAADHGIRLTEPSRFAVSPDLIINARQDKEEFYEKLFEMGVDNPYVEGVLKLLPNPFTLEELEGATAHVQDRDPRLARAHHAARESILWLALSNYEIKFSPEIPLSARVIFPHSPSERNGIEDARFVRFHKDDGTVTYYATYTAWSGHTILPQFLETKDFLHFDMNTLTGKAVQNKGMGLFPRKIGGKYATLSRQDGENIFLMYTDDIHFWREMIPLMKPSYPWEVIKLGNCGSPMEIDDGWLVITHGVGPMRKYCIGAILLDKDDPSKIIGRLREPLLKPQENEREGYVPNVVYSCGSLIHNGKLILPYAMSDSASRIATVEVADLLSELR